MTLRLRTVDRQQATDEDEEMAIYQPIVNESSEQKERDRRSKFRLGRPSPGRVCEPSRVSPVVKVAAERGPRAGRMAGREGLPRRWSRYIWTSSRVRNTRLSSALPAALGGVFERFIAAADVHLNETQRARSQWRLDSAPLTSAPNREIQSVTVPSPEFRTSVAAAGRNQEGPFLIYN